MTKTIATILAVAAAIVSINRLSGDEKAAPRPRVPRAADPAPAKAAPEATACSRGKELIEEYCKLYGVEGVSFRPLIVLLPDPIELESRDFFDAMFEGVEQAVEEPHDGVTFVRDRQWLPWPSGGSGTDNPSRCWESEPGVAIYRPNRTDARPLLVLIVGETPTWGLRTEQLAGALDLARQHGCAGEACVQPILGPAFSGTAPSLAATLRQHSPSHERYAVISGTASHPTVPVILRALPEGSTFARTAPNDDVLLREMVEFLKERGGVCPEGDESGNIVLFTESGTLYGSQAASQCVRIIKFSPKLAAISDAFEANDDSPAPKPGSDKAAKAPDALAIAHSLDLGEVLRELSRSRVRFIGIAATDAKDVVALARRVHDELPDVRLFTLSADLSFLSETNAPTLNGMLVAHAAPIARRDVWSTVLESELVRNVFRAGHCILAGEPVTDAKLVVSFVGNGAFWQVDPEQTWLHAPVSWNFVRSLFYVGLLTLAIVIVLRDQTFLRRPGWNWSLVRPCLHGDLEADDRVVLGTLLIVSGSPVMMFQLASNPQCRLCPFLTALVGAFPLWFMLGGVLRRRRWTLGASLLVVSAVIAAVLAPVLAAGPKLAPTYNLMSGGSPVLVGLIGLASFAVALWCSHVRLHMLDSHRFESGFRSLGTFDVGTPPIAAALGENPDRSTGLLRTEADLLRTIRAPGSFNVIVLLVRLGFIASVVGSWMIRSPRTFEPDGRNILLISFGLLATVPAVASFARLLTSWVKLRAVLRGLAAMPSFAALGGIPDRLARPLEAQLTSPAFDDLDLAAAVDILDRIAQSLPSLAKRCASCRTLLDRCSGAQSKGNVSSHRGVVVAILIDVSGELHRADDIDRPTRAIVDELGAALVAIFLPRYVRHFRLFVPQLVIGSLASVFMTSLYFVEPQRLVGTVIFLWIIALVVALLVVYISLETDPVMSAIARTTAHKVSFNWALVQRVVGLALLPAASLLSLQRIDFPIWMNQVIDVVGKALR